MASVLNSKAKFYQFDSQGNERFQEQIQSEADIFIKKLSQKQRDTDVNLEKCLNTEKQFELSHTFKPLTETSTGTLNFEDFKQLSADLEQKKDCPADSSAPEQTNKRISRHVRELALAVKPNSLETKLLEFAISCNAIGEISEDSRPPEHPINQLDKIENELFSHLSLPNNPEKTAKTILRKRKQLLEAVSEPFGPEKIEDPPREKTLWDVTEVPTSCKKTCTTKVYSCKPGPKKLFTIKGGKIVEIKNENDSSEKVNKVDKKSLPFISIDLEKNDGLETRSKLSEEEIRKIPKFHNYEKGTPSKVLYLKNLSSSVSEKDLVKLFSKYQEPGESRIIYKLMQKGKMRGQAFIHFSNIATSTRAVEELNGTMLNDKPIIIHFGRTNT
ncbi:RNA-binding protein 41-like [Planococcus citri]|uniref:RNA-binding protein 41-like n=1 Tax=Planococcus citri TaxID=170843 RepID=UPI0031F7F61C